MKLSNGERLFYWPLSQHVITAGWTYSDGSAHSAIDLRAAVGTPVYASEDGTVNWVQTWDGHTKTGNQSYGNLVRIQHADYNDKQLETYYAHLSSVLVKSGQTVKEGQLIGYSGETGNCYGAHLHFEVRLNRTRLNPLNWLDADFSCASDSVRAHLGSYKSVSIPEDDKYPVIIDVSKYQGDIVWEKVPYPAIIRVGYRGYETGACAADEKFERNITGAIKAGKLYGFYFFSQAITQEEAAAEANFASNLIAGRGRGLPLFIDCEWSNPNHNGRADGISKETRTACAEAFCENAQSNGFIAGVYTFTTFARANIDYEKLANRYVGWLADTRANYDTALPRHIHQYGQGDVDGINGLVDLNHVIKEIAKQEAKPVNQLQKICIVGTDEEIKAKAESLGLPVQTVTAQLIGPASTGDAMTLWIMAQGKDDPYFSSFTEA